MTHDRALFGLVRQTSLVGNRQGNPKHRAAGLGIQLNDAAVIGDSLGDEGEPETRTGSLGRDERLKQIGAQILLNARAVILD